jgi:hypothetical protein
LEPTEHWKIFGDYKEETDTRPKKAQDLTEHEKQQLLQNQFTYSKGKKNPEHWRGFKYISAFSDTIDPKPKDAIYLYCTVCNKFLNYHHIRNSKAPKDHRKSCLPHQPPVERSKRSGTH